MNATWIGHKLVPFGSAACDKFRKERLHHLHRVRFEGSMEKSGAPSGRFKLAAGQGKEIAASLPTLRKLRNPDGPS
jgi:hypothetical protein